MLWDIWKRKVQRIFVRRINKLYQPSKKLDFSSMVMRNRLVLPCVTFRPAHRVARILYSARDKETGLSDEMIKYHRWPHLRQAWETPRRTTELLLHLNIQLPVPLGKFMALEKRSTIPNSFEKEKEFKILESKVCHRFSGTGTTVSIRQERRGVHTSSLWVLSKMFFSLADGTVPVQNLP